ncbi:hypothetical protein AAMO2058_001103400 [Amorphochlora amoebiformis]
MTSGEDLRPTYLLALVWLVPIASGLQEEPISRGSRGQKPPNTPVPPFRRPSGHANSDGLPFGPPWMDRKFGVPIEPRSSMGPGHTQRQGGYYSFHDRERMPAPPRYWGGGYSRSSWRPYSSADASWSPDPYDYSRSTPFPYEYSYYPRSPPSRSEGYQDPYGPTRGAEGYISVHEIESVVRRAVREEISLFLREIMPIIPPSKPKPSNPPKPSARTPSREKPEKAQESAYPPIGGVVPDSPGPLLRPPPPPPGWRPFPPGDYKVSNTGNDAGQGEGPGNLADAMNPMDLDSIIDQEKLQAEVWFSPSLMQTLFQP